MLTSRSVRRNVTLMGGFVKLDSGILDSSLWNNRDVRDVFITALLMASPIEIMEAQDALCVRTLDRLGFTVPPGWYGMVQAAGVGIAARANLSADAGLSALEKLSQPDLDSRTPEHDGRRMVRVTGGYLVLNFMRYRDRDYGAKDRMRRYRERQRGQKETVAEPVTPLTRHVTQAEAEDRGHTIQKKRAVARPEGVPEQAWNDWMQVRKAKRAPLTATAWAAIEREAAKAKVTVAWAVAEMVARNWQSFRAEWIASLPTAQQRGRPGQVTSTQHIPNMPLGHISCICDGCVGYRQRSKPAT